MEKPPVLTGARPRGVDLVFFDGGRAHRSGATSVRDALVGLDPTVDARLVDLTTEVFATVPSLHWLFGRGIAVYNAALKAERMYFGDLRTAMRLGAWLSRQVRPGAVPKVGDFYRRSAPRVLVSFVPMHNRLLLEALHLARPEAEGLVVPVDLGELFTGYWFDRDADVDYFCGTPRLAADAVAAGVAPGRVHAVPGMPTHPRFHAPLRDLASARELETERASERRRLGLDPERPTVLLFFGAQGSQRLVDIARHLDAAPARVNLVVVCGHHEAARRELSSWSSRSPRHVVGFTREVPSLMRAADVLVGKPGPLTIFEALASGLPLVLWDNPAFGVLFDVNLAWVESTGVGVRVRRIEEVAHAVGRVLGSPSFRQSTAGHAGDATGRIARDILKRLG